MKVIIDIPEEVLKYPYDYCCNTLVNQIKGNCTYIPDNATNGDMIKAMFPNCEQKEHINNGYFEMYFDKDLGNASYMRVSKDWWDAPYKKEVKE